METTPCSTCNGRRLTQEALNVHYLGMPIDELNALPLTELADKLVEPRGEAERILLRQVVPTLDAAIELGIGHLSLDRPAATLSGGELQRLRLASQLHSGLFGVVYVLDEPTAGLHPEERPAVVDIMRRFIDSGNSVITVEHDMDVVRQADWRIDIDDGRLAYSGEGEPGDTPTGRALRAPVPTPNSTPRKPTGAIQLRNVNDHNLQDISVDLPEGSFTAVTGLSGSGKTTLVDAIGKHTSAVHITQKPIGRTRRSTVATYTGLFDKVRKMFAQATGLSASQFSYNNASGQCPTCKGEGKIEVELIFLPGSYTTCPDCDGARYNEETLQAKWNGYSIADILALTADEADFLDMPEVKSLQALGLGYLKLGQGAPELSGGEAQRIRLVTELQHRSGTYVLDEPSTGLHPADVELLTAELNRIVDAGNTIIVVEHNMRMVAQADHVVELGEGQVLFEGTPAELAQQGAKKAHKAHKGKKNEGCPTGRALAKMVG